jgi:hypothetical protein
MPVKHKRNLAGCGRAAAGGFFAAAACGFSPAASGLRNAAALQRAVDRGGTILVSRPGIYNLAATVYIGSNTSLQFGPGVYLRKVAEQGPFTHVLLNKGALTKTYDRNIAVEGLNIIVNSIDVRKFEVYGLHGQLAFFYIKDLRIDRFRCLDLGPAQYAIHVCTFEDVIIDDVIIKGAKDGVHLGRGKRFTIRNGVFETFDDAVALNAQDYSVGNPELGWIENGVVENCHDLAAPKTTGFFCRILAGAWSDWRPGMPVQQSDSVVANGRIYRVQAKPDGTVYTSLTKPAHARGSAVLDGINWGVVQEEVTYTAGVRNVVFRDIFLEKARIAFSIRFCNDKYNRSYYPGAPVPRQEQFVFDGIRLAHDEPFLSINTPVDVVTIAKSSFRNNSIHFHGNRAMADYGPTRINMLGCVFNHPGPMELVTNTVPGKEIFLKTTASIKLGQGFAAAVVPGEGRIRVESDLDPVGKSAV